MLNGTPRLRSEWLCTEVDAIPSFASVQIAFLHLVAHGFYKVL